MEALLIYILKSAGLMSIFYICYLLLLGNDTSFNLNRKYLLGGIAASAILPSIYFTKKVFIETPEQIFYSPSQTLPQTISAPVTSSINLWEVAGYLFLAVTAILFIRFLLQLFRIISLIQTHEHQIAGKFTFIETKQDHGPFSFFKYIVYNPELHTTAEKELIFKHEQVHSSQYHTLDVLISNIACCILWFNPLSWLYKKSLVQNLEFIADKETVAATQSKKQYLKTLIKVSVGDLHPAMTNSFYQSFIKKRIVMLNKSSHSVNNLWKLNLVFPAILAFMFIFNVQTEFYAQERTSKVISNTEVQIEIDKNTTQDKLDGFIKLMDEHNVILKFEDVQYNNEGLLTNIKVEFIDRSNVSSGNITKSNPSGIEAFRYVYNQKEGSRFSTPQSSSSLRETVILKRSGASKNDTTQTDVQTFTYVTSQKKPLYILNGKILDSISTLDTLYPAHIRGVSVLKGYAASAVYGKDARDGAISITTRKAGDTTGYSFRTGNLVLRDSSRLKDVSYTPTKVRFVDLDSLTPSRRNFVITRSNAQYFDAPLLIVDGKVMETDFNMSSLGNSINSIVVIKGAAAVEKYGEDAKGGAVEITTKSSPNIEIPKAFVATLKASTTQEGLRITKEQLLKQAGIEVNFENLKRNKEGLITNIKVIAKHNKSKVSAIFSETGGISQIYLGLINDQVVVSSNPPRMN